ncbi:MAG: hypothetical protein Ct9H300mP11_29060 [Chloroflexota bacterium]|nr:MAG: hypothetical protein Ct9H300mP11_29060 [Chloroflexota bacterium]
MGRSFGWQLSGAMLGMASGVGLAVCYSVYSMIILDHQPINSGQFVGGRSHHVHGEYRQGIDSRLGRRAASRGQVNPNSGYR